MAVKYFHNKKTSQQTTQLHKQHYTRAEENARLQTEEYFSSHTKFDEATEDIDELIQEEIEDVVDIEVPNLDYQC